MKRARQAGQDRRPGRAPIARVDPKKAVRRRAPTPRATGAGPRPSRAARQDRPCPKPSRPGSPAAGTGGAECRAGVRGGAPACGRRRPRSAAAPARRSAAAPPNVPGVGVEGRDRAALRRDPDPPARSPSSPTCTADSTASASACSRRAPSSRTATTPASCRISCPRPRRSATATGASRRSRATCRTAASRSPARSTAR